MSLRKRQSTSRHPSFLTWIQRLEERRLLAAAGTLDVSFSEDGKQTIGVAQPPTFAVTINVQDVAVQSDGKTVVVGNSSLGGFVLARFNVDGSPDKTFGASQDGTVVTYLSDQYTKSEGRRRRDRARRQNSCRRKHR